MRKHDIWMPEEAQHVHCHAELVLIVLVSFGRGSKTAFHLLCRLPSHPVRP